MNDQQPECDFSREKSSRREMLRKSACGFGGIALAGLLSKQKTQAKEFKANDKDSKKVHNTLAARAPMFPPRAKRVIFILSLIHI